MFIVTCLDVKYEHEPNKESTNEKIKQKRSFRQYISSCHSKIATAGLTIFDCIFYRLLGSILKLYFFLHNNHYQLVAEVSTFQVFVVPNGTEVSSNTTYDCRPLAVLFDFDACISL